MTSHSTRSRRIASLLLAWPCVLLLSLPSVALASTDSLEAKGSGGSSRGGRVGGSSGYDNDYDGGTYVGGGGGCCEDDGGMIFLWIGGAILAVWGVSALIQRMN